jgi:hypothetical protein
MLLTNVPSIQIALPLDGNRYLSNPVETAIGTFVQHRAALLSGDHTTHSPRQRAFRPIS